MTPEKGVFCIILDAGISDGERRGLIFFDGMNSDVGGQAFFEHGYFKGIPRKLYPGLVYRFQPCRFHKHT